MKQVNEKIGYVDPEQFNFKYVVETVISFMTSGEEIKWQKQYDVNGKKNVKDIDGFGYHTFTFDLKNDKLGFIKLILVNIIDKKVNSYKFNGFIEGEEVAFYSSVDSTVDKGKHNCGYIYIYYNYFAQWNTDKHKLYEELTPIIYHELRHYYDNIIGVFDGSTKELLHITLIADELDINTKTFISQMKETGTKTDLTFKDFLYVSEPTELNAWYHTFVQTMMGLQKKHPEFKKDDYIKFIKENEAENHAFFIYNYAVVYKKPENYKMVINTSCGSDPVKLFYYISTTLTACNPSEKTLKKLNDLFEKKYMNYFTDTIDTKLFGTKLQEFCNDCYIDYVYKKIAPKYLHTVKNMTKFISTLC